MPGIMQLSVRPPIAVFGTTVGLAIVICRMVCFAVSLLVTIAPLTVPLRLVLPPHRAMTIPTLL